MDAPRGARSASSVNGTGARQAEIDPLLEGRASLTPAPMPQGG
jgi:hypothetical protein